jgi:pyruvyl transferase EpsO
MNAWLKFSLEINKHMTQNPNSTGYLSTPEKIRDVLHTSLERLGPLEECALLDYPNHCNIGDNLIWLGEVFYLIDILKIKIKYAVSHEDFSEAELEKKAAKAPILLHGGGNLGDLWPRYQKFREDIIAKYRDRPIIILPQSIYFANPENLTKAATIFNAHPNLTLFARENYSYELALNYFHQCRVIKAPDSAFEMVNMPLPSFNFNPKRPILYLCRKDSELNQGFASAVLDIPNLVVQDWDDSPRKWIYRGRGSFGELKEWYWRLPGIVLLIREGWQRRLAKPKEWFPRQRWERSHPYAEKFNSLDNPFIHRFSWSLMHSGVYQLTKHSLVITNRLHGHILCVLLGIPNILLPNSYYKNQAFYETWTYQIPFCRFVKEPAQVKDAVQELLSSFSATVK